MEDAIFNVKQIIDINDKWLFIKNYLTNAIKANAKSIKCNNNKRNVDSFPWFDNDLVKLRLKKDKSYVNWLKDKNNEKLKSDFLLLKQNYNKLLRKKQIDYFSSKDAKDFKNSKKFWEFYSSVIKLKNDNKNDDDIRLKLNDTLLTNKADIANEFNNFFSDLKANVIIDDKECSNFIFHQFKDMNINIEKQFNFSLTSEDQLIKLVNQLDTNSSAGVSNIPTKFFKACVSVIAPLLVMFFNDCLILEKIPDEWKCAIVLPLYKNKGDKNDINNYRGISILSPIVKIFERILSKQITNYFNCNQLLYMGQHGFRSDHSCETAVHEIVTECLKNLEKKRNNLLLFIDFRKAFDLVDRDILLLKLANYGFSNEALNLIRNYFSLRKQFVKLGDVSSKLVSIDLGVPQGSVLGPLLFLIFINDLPNYMLNSSIKMFADDTTIYLSDDNYDDLIINFKKQLSLLLDWCRYNKMEINWSKTYFMFINYNKKLVTPSEIKFNDIIIKVVNSFKLLGVTIDSNLCFSEFVSNICINVNKKLFSIKRIFYLSTSVKIQFFKTFCLPYFDYCLTLIIYFSKALITKLCKCYFSCLYKLFKFNFVNMNVSAINNFLKRYNLFAFQYRVFYRLCLFIFKNKTALNAPSFLKQQLNPEVKQFRYNLRNPQLFFIDKHVNKYSNMTIKYYYIKLTSFININYFTDDFINFKKYILDNLDVFFVKFSKIFDQFNLTNFCKFFYC